MALIDNLVSYWKLDESSGNAADSVGSNTLTNTNSATYSAGKINNGVAVARASSQYLTITDATQSGLDITGSLSFSFWMKPSSQADARAIFAKYNTTGNQMAYQFRVGASSGLAFWADLSSNGSAVTQVQGGTVTWNNGTWYHIVFVYTASAGTVDCYSNGSNITTLSGFPTSLFNSSANFNLGVGLLAGGEYFDGMIDEAGIWSRALTSTEVTELYNSGAGLAYPFTTYNPAIARRRVLLNMI